MWKICTKCKKHKALWEFSLDKSRKLSTTVWCKSCNKEYSKEYIKTNKEKLREKYKNYYRKNKDRINSRDRTEESKIYYNKNRDAILNKKKQYREANKERISEICRNSYNKHRDKRLLMAKAYREANIDKVKAAEKKYSKENKAKILKHHRKYSHRGVSYEIYKDRLTIEELPRLSSDGKTLEVKCRYCGKYFIPTQSRVRHRISALNGDPDSFIEKALYCSDECMVACPVYKNKGGISNQIYRESMPAELRQLVFERDNHECVICGAPAEICHHVDPVAYEPMLSEDPDSCISVCKECHKEIHRQPGCTYNELRKYSVNNCSVKEEIEDES